MVTLYVFARCGFVQVTPPTCAGAGSFMIQALPDVNAGVTILVQPAYSPLAWLVWMPS